MFAGSAGRFFLSVAVAVAWGWSVSTVGIGREVPRPPRRWPLSRHCVLPRPSLPPPLTGRVGGLEVLFHLWPPSVRESPHVDARRLESGTLRGYWLVVRVP